MLTKCILLIPCCILGYYYPITRIIPLLLYFYCMEILDIIKPAYVITKGNGNDKVIALTIDDMPYGSHEKIINLLNKFQQKATFFIISDYINNSNIDILIDAVKNGHQLGNHGKTDTMHAILSEKQLKYEIETCDRLIKFIYDKANVDLPKVMVYRPGSGIYNNTMDNIMKQYGYKLILGNIYPQDPMIRSSIINYLYIISKISWGSIIIIHDRPWTIALLEWLLQYLSFNKYKAVKLTDILH